MAASPGQRLPKQAVPRTRPSRITHVKGASGRNIARRRSPVVREPTGPVLLSSRKYRYPEEVDLPPTSSRLKDVDGLGTSVDHYSSSAVESPRKSGYESPLEGAVVASQRDHSPSTVESAIEACIHTCVSVVLGEPDLELCWNT
ncbi:hypothetical protein HPB52_016383 [Rhipicephalus sanguineus]|uniref:Uncharacterized protein n=1 Tax=Rhipicephalus sanguineus TaxID=34632 RepID=A0A9D4Q0X7_RHISA|nr:hypothetical protein HPB52_016383 [Rhipicephalus sanguineus]